MKNDFTNYTHTIEGHEVKGLSFNSVAGAWLGMVKDPKGLNPEKFTTCSWNKLGKCRNQTRVELNLK